MKIFRELKVRLTDVEWNAMAAAMAAEQAKILEVEAEKAEAMTAFKARLQTHQQRHQEMGIKVRTHEESRAVECEERMDWDRFVVELYRTDSGELVESRAMSALERQETLPGMGPVGEA